METAFTLHFHLFKEKSSVRGKSGRSRSIRHQRLK